MSTHCQGRDGRAGTPRCPQRRLLAAPAPDGGHGADALLCPDEAPTGRSSGARPRVANGERQRFQHSPLLEQPLLLQSIPLLHDARTKPSRVSRLPERRLGHTQVLAQVLVRFGKGSRVMLLPWKMGVGSHGPPATATSRGGPTVHLPGRLCGNEAMRYEHIQNQRHYATGRKPGVRKDQK